jgi:tetratricopeptide (TPR) repeat protein
LSARNESRAASAGAASLDLERLCERFEKAWQGGVRPAIEDYLPPAGPARRPALVELVQIDLEVRLKAGEPGRVEEYLGRFPELAADRAAVLDLAAAEYHLRRRREPGLTPAEYLARLPEYRDELPAVLQAASGDPDSGPAGTTSGGLGPTVPYEGAIASGVSPELPAVPGYEVLAELGRGGMGVVYQARQKSLKRLVALKMIRSGAYAGTEERQRFLREAEAVASLQHPNIVQIHEIGTHDGLSYFSLEFVDGGTLAGKLGDKPLLAEDASRLVETLARAVAHAHQRGIIHRDLKPANVLLSADGTPKVTDFGLAKQLQAEAGQTQSGAILGTPSYMAPEQASGQTRDVGPPTDVYALGAILYEALTGRPPFRAATVLETLQQVRAQDPTPPRALNPKVPRDLETICLKCLRKEPAGRYSSALALAQDLERFVAGESILARPEGLVSFAWRKTRRHLARAAVAAVTLAALAGAGYLFLLYRHSSRRDEISTAVRAELDALDGTDEQLRRVDTRLDELAQVDAAVAGSLRQEVPRRLGRFLEDYLRRDLLRAEDKAHIDAALVLLDRRAPDLAGPLRRARDSRYKEWEPVLDLRPPFADLGRQIPPTQVEARGAALVLRGDIPAAGPVPQVVTLTAEASAGNIQLEAEFPELPEHGSPLGLVLNGNATDQSPFTGSVRALAFSPDGGTLAVGGSLVNGTPVVHLWDPAAGQYLGRLEGLGGGVLCLAYAPDGHTLATGSSDGRVRLWDTTTRRERSGWAVGEGSAFRLAFSPDGRKLAAGCGESALGPGRPFPVKVWETATGNEVAVLRGHAGSVWGVAFAPDGRHLASGGSDATVRLWDVASGQPGAVLHAETWISSVAYAPDGSSVFAAANNLIHRWDVATGQLLSSWEGFAAGVYGLAFSPDGKTLAAVHDGGWLKLWDVRAGRLQGDVVAHAGRGIGVAFSPDGRLIATGGEEGFLKVWDAATRREVFRRGGKGYTFLVVPDVPAGASRAGAFRRQGGSVRVEIRRDGEVVRETTARVPPGRLRLRARREGNQLEFQVNDLEPLHYWDMAPLYAQSGHYGVVWAPGVALTRLRGLQGPPSVGGPLERGDELYADGNYAEALDQYDTQARVAAATPDGQQVRWQADCKRGLCLLRRNRAAEARALFSRLDAEPATNRWLLFASFRLWLMDLEEGEFTRANAVLERLRGRYPDAPEQLASLFPGDLRERIRREFALTGQRLRQLLFGGPGAVPRLRQTVLLADLMRLSPEERLGARRQLRWTLQRTGDQAGAALVAQETLEQFGGTPGQVLSWEERTALLHLVGRDAEALAEVDAALFAAPGVYREDTGPDRLPLLLERARVHGRLGNWAEAVHDLDQFFVAPTADRQELALVVSAHLLHGLAREQAGDPGGARQTWRRGLEVLRGAAGLDLLKDAADIVLLIDYVTLAARAEDLSDAEAAAFINRIARHLGEEASAVESAALQPLSPAVLRKMWSSPRGRELSRRMACRDTGRVEMCRLTGLLAVAEYVRQGCWPGEPAPDEDAAVWQTVGDVFDGFCQGRLNELQLAPLAAAWKGPTALFLWKATEGAIADAAWRAELDYLLGRRYLHHFHKADTAAELFSAAIKLAPGEARVARLARAEAERLKPGK